MEHAVAVPAPVADDSPETESRFSNSFLRLKKFLMRKTGEAIVDYGMIEEGDVVMVCVSGGKDSFTLLSLLLELRERAPINFRVVAMNITLPGCARKKSKFPLRMLRPISKMLLQKNPIKKRWINIEVPTRSTIWYLVQPAIECVCS